MRQCEREESHGGQHSRRSRPVALPPERDAGESEAGEHEPAKRSRAARERDGEPRDQAGSGERRGWEATCHDYETVRGPAMYGGFWLDTHLGQGAADPFDGIARLA